MSILANGIVFYRWLIIVSHHFNCIPFHFIPSFRLSKELRCCCETFWYVQKSVGSPEVALEWQRNRIFSKGVANVLMNLVKRHREAQ